MIFEGPKVAWSNKSFKTSATLFKCFKLFLFDDSLLYSVRLAMFQILILLFFSSKARTGNVVIKIIRSGYKEIQRSYR